MGYKPYEMPEGVKAALKRLASAAKRDGVVFIQAVVNGGEIGSVYVCDTQDAIGDANSDKTHFLYFIDGAFYEHVQTQEV
jgi:Ni,Fe-hydrogenase maturation factor